jgi:hypothetical protein
MKEKRIKFSPKGYALLTALFAICIFAVLAMRARTMWETEIQRDMEEELIFRARQYVTALDFYMQKNANVPPQKLDVLYEKKFLRKRFKDPITNSEKWNVVMRAGAADKGQMWIVPEDSLSQFIGQAALIGVSSTSCEEGFKEYRKKKKYCEWAFYMGDDPKKEMPELKFIGAKGPKSKEKGKDDESTIEETPKPGSGRGEEKIERRSGEDEQGRESEEEPGREKPHE